MKEKINRGDVFYAKLYGAIGSEQKGNRPVVIIQNNIGNKFSKTVIVVPLTRKIGGIKTLPTHVELKAFGNIKYDSSILTEQVRTLDKRRLGKKLEVLPNNIVEQLDNSLTIAQGLEKLNRNKEEMSIAKRLISFFMGGKNEVK